MMESGAFQTDAAVVVLPSANQFVKVPVIDTRGAGFSQVLLEIDNELVKRDIRALKFLCRDTLTGAKLQSITRGLDLFSHLEYNGVICREDILFLGELLFRIGRVDCLRKLGYSWEELKKHLQAPHSRGRQIPPYRVLLFEISEDLSKGEVQELKFLMKKELSQTRLAEIKDGADIFVSMEQAGILTPTNLNYLIEYFGYIDRNDLRNIAIAFQLKVQNQHAAQATDETQPLQQQQHQQQQCEQQQWKQQQWDQQQEQQWKQQHQQLEQQQKQQQVQQWKQQQEQQWKQQQWKQQQWDQLQKQQLQQQQPQGSPSYFTNQSAQPSKGHQVQDDNHAGLKEQMSDHKYKVPEMHEMEDVERKTFLTSTGDAPIVARSEEHTFNPRPAEDLTIPVPADTATNIPIHVLEASESEALTTASVAQRLSGLQISGDGHVQPTTMDEEFPAYKMDKNPRGECIIINNEHFEQNPLPGCKKLPNRDGTQFDEDKLGEIWTNLHFKVTIFKDRSSIDIMNIINHFSRIDHKEYDCVVVCILSHGLTGLLYGTDGKTVKISDLTGFFRGINCPSLIGKPKLFFIQACQGKDKNEAVEIPETDGPAPVDEGSIAVTLPNEADFLLGYATMPGYVSYRSRSSGSWYISKLAEVLQKHASRYDLMSMLTKVNEEVSKATVTKDGRSYAQSPAPLTSLRKKVYFY